MEKDRMLGEKIKEIREKEGLTQEEFAKEVFVSRTTVTKWETGKSLPSIDTLRLISEKYNVSIDELLHNEAESGFYKNEKKGLENLELTKKQKITAFVVFFAVAALIFVSITLTQVKNAPLNYSEVEVNDFREAMKIVPGIIEQWADEKCYVSSGTSTGFSVISQLSSTTFSVYQNEEDKDNYKELYRLYFTMDDHGLEVSAFSYDDDPDKAMEKAFDNYEELDSLIKRLTNTPADTEAVRERGYDLIAPDHYDDVKDYKESLRKNHYYGAGDNLVDMFITETHYDSDDEPYKAGLPDYEVETHVYLKYDLTNIEKNKSN